MDRRKFLQAGGAVIVSASVAGCGEDTNYEDGSGGGNGGGSEEALEILEHELVREDEGTMSETVKVEGRAENVSEEQLSYVEVRARFYNDQGDQLESSLDNTNDLGTGSTWAFEIQYPAIGEDAAEVADYDIGVGTDI
jgi:hypothetical protein